MATKKPLTIVDANQNIRAFITKVNNPRVKILIGKVRINISGLTTAFISPKIAEVSNAGQKPEKLMPGTM